MNVNLEDAIKPPGLSSLGEKVPCPCGLSHGASLSAREARTQDWELRAGVSLSEVQGWHSSPTQKHWHPLPLPGVADQPHRAFSKTFTFDLYREVSTSPGHACVCPQPIWGVSCVPLWWHCPRAHQPALQPVLCPRDTALTCKSSPGRRTTSHRGPHLCPTRSHAARPRHAHLCADAVTLPLSTAFFPPLVHSQVRSPGHLAPSLEVVFSLVLRGHGACAVAGPASRASGQGPEGSIWLVRGSTSSTRLVPGKCLLN